MAKKNWAEKNGPKKYWPIYWPPHPQGHTTIHTSSSFVKKLHKNCLDERMMNIYVVWIYPFQPALIELRIRQWLHKQKVPGSIPGSSNLIFFVISKEMHKSEYLIKFAFPFSSKLISLWLVMTCKLQVLTSPREMTWDMKKLFLWAKLDFSESLGKRMKPQEKLYTYAPQKILQRITNNIHV